jgi:radical SAM superfamily enzyme with C-terminal helix-hairpin-helix motif
MLGHFFEVGWGEGDTPPVKVTIDGNTKELLAIDMQIASFSHRPLMIITNAVELNSIPDPPVKHLQGVPSTSQTILQNSTNSPPGMPPFQRKVQ